jgi:hypothetical protein
MTKFYRVSLGGLALRVARHLQGEEIEQAQALVDACQLVGIPLTAAKIETAYASLVAVGATRQLEGLPIPLNGPERTMHIVGLRDDGWSLRNIGEYHNLSHERVRQLLEEYDAQGPAEEAQHAEA